MNIEQVLSTLNRALSERKLEHAQMQEFNNFNIDDDNRIVNEINSISSCIDDINSLSKISFLISHELNNDNILTELSSFNEDDVCSKNIRFLKNSVSNYNDMKNKYAYLAADFDNFKKRSAKEKENVVKLANKDLIISLLDVVDNFDRMMSVKCNNNDTMMSGIEMTYKSFLSVLSKNGCTPINCKIGDEFNVSLHEAISVMPVNENCASNTIAQIISSGWMLNDVVIRPTKVIVYS